METTVIIHAEEPILNIILPEVEDDSLQEGFDYEMDFAVS